MRTLNSLEKKVIELSYKNKLTHVSSCLNTVNVLDHIYKIRKDGDPVILANSHAALALYVVLESNGYCDAQEMIEKHGTHAGRDMEHGIWLSGGSLGQAETISLGYALANRDRTVWLVTSDGAIMEGSAWEAFRVASELNLMNLKIYLIANGLTAYRTINVDRMVKLLVAVLDPIPLNVYTPKMPFRWLEGLGGHYQIINSDQYVEAMK